MIIEPELRPACRFGAQLPIAVALALGLTGTARAEDGDRSDRYLDAVTVVATGVSNMTAASEGDVGQEQLASTPLPGWTTKLEVFQLKLRSELVFSGDAGVTSPSGSTTRTGIEWGKA